MGGSVSIELTENSSGVVVAWEGDINTFAHGTPTCSGLSKSIATSSVSQISFGNGIVLEEASTSYLRNNYTLPNTELYQVVEANVDGCGSGTFPLTDIVGGSSMFGFQLNGLSTSLAVYSPDDSSTTSSDPTTVVSGSAFIAGQTLADLGFSIESECYIRYVACSGESGYAGGPKTEVISLTVVEPSPEPSSSTSSPSPTEVETAETDDHCDGLFLVICFLGNVLLSATGGISDFLTGIFSAVF